MEFAVKTTQPESETVDALVLTLFEDQVGLPDYYKPLDDAIGCVMADLIASKIVTGKAGNQFLVSTAGKLAPRRLLLLGAGKLADFNLEKLRQLMGRVISAGKEFKLGTISFGLGEGGADTPPALDRAQAVAEGAYLGAYTYDTYRTDRDEPPFAVQKLVLCVPDKLEAAVRKGVEAGTKIAEAVCFCRDLVQAPALDLTPIIMADKAKEMAAALGIKCEILTEKEMETLGMGALLGVAKGALKVQPPRFIILEYLPNKDQKPIVFVGKGITFDSGGISIKPADGMEKMKYDMAGGAAVIGALKAIASLKLPINVVGLVPASENMPGGGAIHPGDILKAMNGKTIEVINTDAEGRLVLSDALCYAERYDPVAVVDLATLTGACVIALGHQAIGVLGNDQALIDRVRAAGDRAWERAWQLPLWEEYNDSIKSDIADMKNSGGRAGGAITAAAMLAKFTTKYKWAHLDIAGTAWEEKGRPYAPKGATGVGVRLLVELAKDYASNGAK